MKPEVENWAKSWSRKEYNWGNSSAFTEDVTKVSCSSPLKYQAFTLHSSTVLSSLCYKVKLAFSLPFHVTFTTAHSRSMGSLCIEDVSMHTNIHYYGRLVFFSNIILQAFKLDVHSSFLNLHDYLHLHFYWNLLADHRALANHQIASSL